MRSPVEGGLGWLVVEEAESTQKLALEVLNDGAPVGVVFAKNQTAGVGRFGREWFSEPGDSLTMTLLFRQYPSHPKPYLIGMATALATAAAIHSHVQWPNDLVIGSRKVGGILTQVVPDPKGEKIALVGVGINLNQSEFPPQIADRAISLRQAHGRPFDPSTVASEILERLEPLPEPEDWADLSPIWALFDSTPGKQYLLPDGQSGLAIAVGSDGQLLCSVAGESQSILAADALFGA